MRRPTFILRGTGHMVRKLKSRMYNYVQVATGLDRTTM